MAEAADHRIKLAVLPVAGELGEVVMLHVVEGIVRRVHLIDQVAALDQDAGIFGIGVDDVEGAGGRLRQGGQHVVAAGVVFRLELDVVLGLEGFDHVRFRQAIPGQHVDFGGLRPAAVHKRREQGYAGGSPGILQELAPCRLG